MPGTGNSYEPLSPGTQFQWMPRHTRLRPRQFVTTLSALLLLFTFTSFFYWGDLELFAFPEKSAWSSDATNFDEIFIREAQLPQHNLSARYPEGRDGRFLRFSNQVWGVGWNNLLQERLLNTILAYESNRAPVFSPFEAWAHPPRNDKTPTGERHVLVIPSNALFSGPAAGASWGPGNHHPRAISDKWWNVACPLFKRKVIKADDIFKQIGKQLDGDEILSKWTSLLKDIPDKCVEIIGTQVFDFYLIGSTRVLSLWDMFSNHPAIRQLDDSEIVKAAVAKNMAKLQKPSGFSQRPRIVKSNLIAGLMAIHVRRGDYLGDEGQDNGHCLHFSKWGSTFSGWNQLSQLRDKFDAPPRGNIEWGTNTPELVEHYLRRCLPSPAQVASRLRAIRAENRRISHIFVATNAEKRYLSELRVVLVADGWAPDKIIMSKDLKLNWQATSVAMAVDMSILSRAEVFVGNGFSSMSSNVAMRRLTTGMGLDSIRFW
ncbi:GDP-fucose protein O-fucosyltransferase [Rhizoctonia solani 123E]|uniref:GDP-fucose protein O-fucosyltransferase n=1 Tax=Rhizoctonia solani 123E TaxID=1423351 RepID=A0A074RJ88_9AGAM|nr:GDP-fucose protein O-fucosyltransferase [Rhizoctonia solani 123E]